jgi:hypothetical protein
MPVAKNQKIIDSGREMIYLTRFVKLQSRKKFPAKPNAKDIAFITSSLDQISFILPI